MDNFLSANNLLRCLFRALSQSTKSLLFNLRDKLVANQMSIMEKLDHLISICKNTREFSDDEFLNVKHALTQANKHFEEISERLNLMMNKIRDLEDKHHFQIQKELEIEFITQETRDKLSEQKLLLDQIANLKFPSRSPSPPPVPQPKKEVDDRIKQTIRRFDQPTLSQMSKTTKAKTTTGQLHLPKEVSPKATLSAASSSTSLAGATHGESSIHEAAAATSSATEISPTHSDSSEQGSKKTDLTKKSSTLSSKAGDKKK